MCMIEEEEGKKANLNHLKTRHSYNMRRDVLMLKLNEVYINSRVCIGQLDVA